MPDTPDPRVTFSRSLRICSRRCENRERHRRDLPETTCHRKARFASIDDAEQVITRYGKQDTHTPYECRHCDYVHIGRYYVPPPG